MQLLKIAGLKMPIHELIEVPFNNIKIMPIIYILKQAIN